MVSLISVVNLTNLRKTEPRATYSLTYLLTHFFSTCTIVGLVRYVIVRYVILRYDIVRYVILRYVILQYDIVRYVIVRYVIVRSRVNFQQENPLLKILTVRIMINV